MRLYVVIREVAKGEGMQDRDKEGRQDRDKTWMGQDEKGGGQLGSERCQPGQGKALSACGVCRAQRR